MKKLLPFISIYMLLVVLYSCKKDKDDPANIATYTGYIYNAADSTPYANTSFKLYQLDGGNLGNGYKSTEEVKPFTTNDEGYFSVEFNVISNGTIWVCFTDTKNYDCKNSSTSTGFNPSNKDVGILYVW